MDDGTALAAAFAPAAFAPGGEGRLGLWTRSGGAILRARRESFEPHMPAGGAALRRLDVTLLEVALERLCRIDAAAVASGERIAYAKSSADAVDAVSRRIGGADAAFLLDPIPVADDHRRRRGWRRHAAEVDLLLSEGPHRPRPEPP